MSIDAMKRALEALEGLRDLFYQETIDALRAAIEAAEKQEPVAWMGEYNINDIRDHYTVVMRHKTDFSSMPDRVRPLYTHPQPAIPEWQPIETAPRNGTRILTFNKTLVYDEDTGKTEVMIAMSVVYWAFGGWMEYPANPRYIQGQEHTHWMPLPAAPKEMK